MKGKKMWEAPNCVMLTLVLNAKLNDYISHSIYSRKLIMTEGLHLTHFFNNLLEYVSQCLAKLWLLLIRFTSSLLTPLTGNKLDICVGKLASEW